MITAKLTHNAIQRINAFKISQVQLLIQAVKDYFKLEGTGTYMNLQRWYMSLMREKYRTPKHWALRSGRFMLKSSFLTLTVLFLRLSGHSSLYMHLVLSMRASATIFLDKWTLLMKGILMVLI